MVGNGTGNAGDGNEKPPHGFAMRGLVVDAWAILIWCSSCARRHLTPPSSARRWHGAMPSTGSGRLARRFQA